MVPYTLLSHRIPVKITGCDRLSFLQGLLTNNVLKLAPGAACYAALLNPQGRFLHDFLVFTSPEQDAVYLTPERARIEDLLTRLSRYKLRAAVDVAVREDSVVTVWNNLPSAIPVLTSAPDPRHPAFGTVALICASETDTYTRLPLEQYDTQRIRLGIPDGSRDMVVGESLLLDYNIDKINGISWIKGCYVGQELTARMHYRALGKKELRTLALDSGTFPATGTVLKTNEAEIGVMAGHCGTLGLAVLYKNRGQNDTVVTQTFKARIVPFVEEGIKPPQENF